MAAIPLGSVPSFQGNRRGSQSWCLRHGDEVLNWGELDAASTRRAHALAAAGVRRDDLVVMAIPNCNQLYELTFALWKLGATPSVVSGNLPAAELAAILEIAEPRLYIAEGPPAEARPGALPFSFGSDHGDTTPIEPQLARYWKAMASGGSTGRPKLIVARQQSLFDPEMATLGLPADSVILNPGPCHHNMPFALTHLGLLRGNSIVGMPRFDALEAIRLIEKYRVEWMQVVPTMMSRIWSLPGQQREAVDMSSLRMVWHTAAPIPHWLKRAWIDWLGPERIFEVYGGTEGIGVTTLSGSEWLAHPGSVGRPVGCSIGILDEAGNRLPAGETGEVFFFPPEGSEDDAFHYVGGEIRRGPDGAISLGDQGWLDEDGFLFVTGRRTDLILSGGENVYPAEIEDVLSAFPGVAAVVAIGLPDDDLGEIVHAIVELDPSGPAVDEAGLRKSAEDRLVRIKRPRSYEFVREPLRDAAGKVRRGLLRDRRLKRTG